jgi:hypothetical protein
MRQSRHDPWDPTRLEVFGAFLRRGRQCAGLSQQRLANLAGVSQTLISRLERGKAAHVGLDRILAIQTVLGGCFPLGVCPHDHSCIWRPRTKEELGFLRAPGSVAPPYGREPMEPTEPMAGPH